MSPLNQTNPPPNIKTSYFQLLSFSLTPGICVNVLLTGEEQAGVEGGEDKPVIPGLPGDLDAWRVGQSGNGDAVSVLDGRAERLGHLLFTHAPVGGRKGYAAQEEGHDRLDEGEARGADLLEEGHNGGGGRRAGRWRIEGVISESYKIDLMFK